MNPLKFIAVAQAMATLSKDPSTQVGAVVLDMDCNILSVGCNGFPRGVTDSPVRWEHKPTKYKFVVHAEANAIAQAARVGARLLGSQMIITSLHPCSNCAGMIAQSGIKRVFAPANHRIGASTVWAEEAEYAKHILKEAGVEGGYYLPLHVQD